MEMMQNLENECELIFRMQHLHWQNCGNELTFNKAKEVVLGGSFDESRSPIGSAART